MARHHSSSAHLRLVVVGAATVLAASTAALAADTAKEIATAAQHTDLAATAADIKMTKTHLHHTINCLVGPKGDFYFANELNPCQDFGDGAIPETTDPAKKKNLEAALNRAKSGLAAHDPAAAKALASEAEALIKSAM
jgi:hypothetical protein